MPPPTQIYTDGSCRDTIGGYSFIILTDDYELEWADRVPDTTNNRMELTAVIEALRCLPPATSVIVYTDSQWVINCAQKLWKRNKNIDLWAQYDSVATIFTSIQYKWVKGHSGDVYNERCDKLAYNEVVKKIVC